eukprot:1031801-Alexandrium_andersonii.AAC.1
MPCGCLSEAAWRCMSVVPPRSDHSMILFGSKFGSGINRDQQGQIYAVVSFVAPPSANPAMESFVVPTAWPRRA